MKSKRISAFGRGLVLAYMHANCVLTQTARARLMKYMYTCWGNPTSLFRSTDALNCWLNRHTHTHMYTLPTLPCYSIARTPSDEETDDSWNEWSTVSDKRGRLADRRSVYVRGNNRKLVNFSEAIIPDKLCEHAKVVLEQFRTKRNKCSNWANINFAFFQSPRVCMCVCIDLVGCQCFLCWNVARRPAVGLWQQLARVESGNMLCLFARSGGLANETTIDT